MWAVLNSYRFKVVDYYISNQTYIFKIQTIINEQKYKFLYIPVNEFPTIMMMTHILAKGGDGFSIDIFDFLNRNLATVLNKYKAEDILLLNGDIVEKGIIANKNGVFSRDIPFSASVEMIKHTHIRDAKESNQLNKVTVRNQRDIDIKYESSGLLDNSKKSHLSNLTSMSLSRDLSADVTVSISTKLDNFRNSYLSNIISTTLSRDLSVSVIGGILVNLDDIRYVAMLQNIDGCRSDNEGLQQLDRVGYIRDDYQNVYSSRILNYKSIKEVDFLCIGSAELYSQRLAELATGWGLVRYDMVNGDLVKLISYIRSTQNSAIIPDNLMSERITKHGDVFTELGILLVEKSGVHVDKLDGFILDNERFTSSQIGIGISTEDLYGEIEYSEPFSIYNNRESYLHLILNLGVEELRINLVGVTGSSKYNDVELLNVVESVVGSKDCVTILGSYNGSKDIKYVDYSNLENALWGSFKNSYVGKFDTLYMDSNMLTEYISGLYGDVDKLVSVDKSTIIDKWVEGNFTDYLNIYLGGSETVGDSSFSLYGSRDFIEYVFPEKIGFGVSENSRQSVIYFISAIEKELVGNVDIDMDGVRDEANLGTIFKLNLGDYEKSMLFNLDSYLYREFEQLSIVHGLSLIDYEKSTVLTQNMYSRGGNEHLGMIQLLNMIDLEKATAQHLNRYISREFEYFSLNHNMGVTNFESVAEFSSLKFFARDVVVNGDLIFKHLGMVDRFSNISILSLKDFNRLEDTKGVFLSCNHSSTRDKELIGDISKFMEAKEPRKLLLKSYLEIGKREKMFLDIVWQPKGFRDKESLLNKVVVPLGKRDKYENSKNVYKFYGLLDGLREIELNLELEYTNKVSKRQRGGASDIEITNKLSGIRQSIKELDKDYEVSTDKYHDVEKIRGITSDKFKDTKLITSDSIDKFMDTTNLVDSTGKGLLYNYSNIIEDGMDVEDWDEGYAIPEDYNPKDPFNPYYPWTDILNDLELTQEVEWEGEWDIDKEQISIGTNHQGTFLTEINGEDYKFRFDVKVGNLDECRTGFVFNYIDDSNYYKFTLSSGPIPFLLTQVINGEERLVASPIESYFLDSGSSHGVEIERIEDRLIIYTDGRIQYDLVIEG